MGATKCLDCDVLQWGTENPDALCEVCGFKAEIARLTRELEEAREALALERGVCAGCGESGRKTCCACYQGEVMAWREQFRALRAWVEALEAERDRLRKRIEAQLCSCCAVNPNGEEGSP